MQMRLEGYKLPCPQRFGRFKPRFQCRHRLVSQTINTHARIEFVALFFDEPARAQKLEVAAHRRKGNARRFGEFAGASRPITQQVHHPPAVRVGQCRERAIEIVGHVNVLYLNPVAFSISSLETVLTGCEKVQWWPSGSTAI